MDGDPQRAGCALLAAAVVLAGAFFAPARAADPSISRDTWSQMQPVR
jgi:hypothetical protein